MPSTTFSIAAGADDAYANSTSPATYGSLAYNAHNSTLSSVIVDRSLSSSQFHQSVGLLQFDTSSLPDNAAITSATLRVYPNFLSFVNSRSLVGEYFTWNSTSGDWTVTAPGSPILSKALSTFTTGVTNDISVTDFSGISKTGTTYLRLQISGGQPTGNNTLWFDSFESSNPEAKLIVTYNLGADLVGMVGI